VRKGNNELTYKRKEKKELQLEIPVFWKRKQDQGRK